MEQRHLCLRFTGIFAGALKGGQDARDPGRTDACAPNTESVIQSVARRD